MVGTGVRGGKGRAGLLGGEGGGCLGGCGGLGGGGGCDAQTMMPPTPCTLVRASQDHRIDKAHFEDVAC